MSNVRTACHTPSAGAQRFWGSATEKKELVFHLVFKTRTGRIKPSVAGSIPAFSAKAVPDRGGVLP